MLSLINKGLKKIFGTKSDKDIKSILPLVVHINEQYNRIKSFTNDKLRAETDILREVIKEKLDDTQKKMDATKNEIALNPDMSLDEKEQKYEYIDSLEKEQNNDLEEVLNEILPTAFAIIKDTARRFSENEEIDVTTNDYDQYLSSKYENVVVNNDKTIWKNKWIVAGNEVTWGMVHYDVQLIGGIILHRGKVAEMATGEGKTLVATLPAFLNALSGKGVHIVTVNDYLAKRDSEWMAPIFQFHGISVDCIDKHRPNSAERKEAYGCDIIYGTNNEFGFDYLRDNGAFEPGEMVQKKHHYVMIDEVDSVLIDEARTPLIISGPVPRGDDHEFAALKPRISQIVAEQNKLTNNLLRDAKNNISEGDLKTGGLALFRAFRGNPKSKALIKYLSEQGKKQILTKTENIYLSENKKLLPQADATLYYTIDEKSNTIDLTDKGIEYLTQQGDDENLFILPDIGILIADIEKSEDSTADKLKKKDAVILEYTSKTKRIHSVNQLLRAYTMFEKDTEYIIVDRKIKIVDEQTGRVMEGRRYSDGLHQAIEAKENVKIEDATQTYATITLQNYFRMYHKLSGMTGTAETEAYELWDIYKLDVVVIPTNVPILRDDQQDKVYKTVREKYKAVIQEAISLSKAGRPILIGTSSVDASELLSKMLSMNKIKHNVLNAKQHAREADVVAEAGQAGAVTIATNMAGRGTDIKLSDDSKKAGGLAIVGTERHESRRVDRQLRGRAGRQGDPGSSQFYVSLEDDLMRRFIPESMAKIMDRLGLDEGEVIQHSQITKSIERAQKKVEENNFGIRKRLLDYDDVMNSQREVIYKRRKNALFGERLDLDILTMFYDTTESIILQTHASKDYDAFRLSGLSLLGIDISIEKDDFLQNTTDELIRLVYEQALNHYNNKNNQIIEQTQPILKQVYEEKSAVVKNIQVPFTDGTRQIVVITDLAVNVNENPKALIKSMERMVTLAFIDQNWKEHLREMDDLKQAVRNAYYEQKDPLVIYKQEGFELFQSFINKVNEQTVSFISKAKIFVESPQQIAEARSVRRQRGQESKADIENTQHEGLPNQQQDVQKTQPIKKKLSFGRNERITVKYKDGSIKENVKYKTVEDDIHTDTCVVIN